MSNYRIFSGIMLLKVFQFIWPLKITLRDTMNLYCKFQRKIQLWRKYRILFGANTMKNILNLIVPMADYCFISIYSDKNVKDIDNNIFCFSLIINFNCV